MLAKRIIPCLDIKDGHTVKGVNFEGLRNAGDPVELAVRYEEQQADELVFLDITATVEKRKTLVDLVLAVGQELSIPFTVGGGISTVSDVAAVLDAGADKVSINSAAVKNPGIIDVLAKEFGSQCIVLAVDSKHVTGNDEVYIQGGRTPTGLKTRDWVGEAVDRGVGEILLTSMDHDGTKAGFALELTARLAKHVSVPIIASGGAGQKQHFYDVFTQGAADAALAASIFHFSEIAIPDLKEFLHTQEVVVRR